MGDVNNPAPVTPVYPDYGGGNSISLGAIGNTTVDIYYDAVDQPNGVSPSVGDIVTVLAVGIDTGWTMPSGWTEIASGRSGDLDWLAAVRTVTGSDSWAFSMPDMTEGWTEGVGDKGTFTLWWDKWTNGAGGVWRAAADFSTGVASKAWWQPSGQSWWDLGVSDYWAWVTCFATTVDTSGSVSHYNTRGSSARDSWVTGYNRRLDSFSSSPAGYPYADTYSVAESTASPTGSEYLMVGIAWDPT